jgi:zinc protease
MNVTSTKLKNGFKIIFATDNSNPLICLQLYVRMGSNWENNAEAGYSHFTEHLVFKSTEKYPANSIMERVTYLGGSINAYTEYDTICFYVTLPSTFYKEGLEILSQLALHANFSLQDFKSEKQVIIEELKQYKNDPEDSFIEEIAEEYFKTNSYKNPIIGDLKNLQVAKYEDLQKFYKTFYTPNNCFLVASGDFEEEELLNSTEEYFSTWKRQTIVKSERSKLELPSKSKFIQIKKNISNDILAFVLPDLSERNTDSYALSLATKIFAVGKNSRLYRRLFDEEKLIDTIRLNSLSGVNDGATVIVIMPKKKADLNRIITIFLEEMERFCSHGINEMELKDHKKEMIFFYRYSFEYVESLASNLGGEEILTGYEKFFSYPEMVEKQTVQNLKRVIEKYFKKKYLYIFQKGKTAFKKTFEDQLQSSSIVPRSSFNTKKYYETELENGMKLLLKKVKGKPTVGVSLSYEVSQLNEVSSNLGINLLSAGLMMYGNEKRNYQQFLNYCTTNGINFGITPQAETTSVKLKCFTEMLPLGLELLSDVVQLPTFPSDYFSNLKNSYLSNLTREKDYPSYYASRVWKEMIFGKDSNLISRSGTGKTIRSISLKKLKHWYETHYHPKNMSLAIVGDINFDTVIEACEKIFVTKKSGFTKSIQSPIITDSDARFKRTNRKQDQSTIILGGFGCNALETQKNTAFHILAQIIGGETDSLLFNELREKRGLAIVDKKREEEALDAIKKTLQIVKNNGISQEELQKTKNYVRGIRLMEEESVLNQAQTLSVLEAIGFGYDYYKQREKRLNDISVENIQDIAAEYFDETNYFIHIMS